MLDGVVKHPRPTRLPLASLRADPEAAARRYHERDVHDQASVGDTRVRRDTRARLQNREKSRGRLSRHLGKRRRRKQRRGLRTAPEALFLPHTTLDQVVRAPAPRAVELPPLVQRRPARIVDIGDHAVGIAGEALQLLAADLLRRRFERPQPGELGALIKLQDRQPGKMHETGLRCVDAPLVE